MVQGKYYFMLRWLLQKLVQLVCNQLILSVYYCDAINPVDFNKYVHISDGLKPGLNEILFILWKPPTQWVTSK